MGVSRLHVSSERYAGFIEAHIEQGPHLEDSGRRIGVVTGIVGLRSIRFIFRGQQNHAGTTMMARRRDATTALYELAHRINLEFPKVAAERTVWTMGRVRVEPNAISIVPGYAELDLQFRDPSEAPLDAFETIVERLVSEMNAARWCRHRGVALARANSADANGCWPAGAYRSCGRAPCAR